MITAITWALAADVVVLHPATIAGTVSLPSETITALTAYAYPSTGSVVQKSITIPSGSSGPYTYQLTVDGGDPNDANDHGVAYTPAISLSLSSPSAGQRSLSIQKQSAVTVDNSPASPSTTVATTFSRPTLYHVNASVTVIGGTLSYVSVGASATDTQAQESYSSSASQGFSTPYPSTGSVSVAMIPSSNVQVSAWAQLQAADGSQSSWSLPAKTVNLSQDGTTVSWTIDLTSTGNLEGTIDLAAAPTSSATPDSYYVYYYGTSAATSGFSGSVRVSPSVPFYSLALTPGDYDVYLWANMTSPSQYFYTKPQRVTIAAGTTLIKDLSYGLAVAREELAVDGFFTAADLSLAQSALRGPNFDTYTGIYQATAGAFVHTMPAGTWYPYETYLSLSNQSNPALPLQVQLYKFYSDDAAHPPATIAAGSDVSLGRTALTLVRSNVYFDVAEPAGSPDINIQSPSIAALKYDFNPDGSAKSYVQLYGYGSSISQPLSGLTLVAEPGQYTLQASAYVNGTYTPFPGTTIWFGEPVATPAGSSVPVTLTPAQNPDLRIDLQFPSVTGAGITTVVETPLGPAPPQGVAALCPQNSDGVACPPVYYDIQTTAQFSGTATVCVRRLVVDVPNAAAEFLHLYHYNEQATPNHWEQLPAPPGRPAAIDCGDGDPASLAACGCASEADCGIDLFATPSRDVFLVCGVTTSFSPYSLFEDKITFTNQVDGYVYSGATGTLQHWTVPGDATYRITATGAQGGTALTAAAGISGGCGAQIAGDFALHKGDVLDILVGQQGTAAANNAGGGGGTFVVKNGVPLVIAGGGGGVRSTATTSGRPGTTGPSGMSGSTSPGYTGSFIPGGSNGAGGLRLASWGAGGGGWSGNGASDGAFGDGGASFLGPDHGKGGSGRSCGLPADGGYGGGGAGNGCFGAGGGGGYSGGGGGRVAGGGGSLNNGLDPKSDAGICTASGHGMVTIELPPRP